MRKLLFALLVLFCVGLSNAQDSTNCNKGIFGLTTFGRELGTLSETNNEVYGQLVFGYKFSEEFGVAIGSGLTYFERHSFVPIFLSVRANRSKPKKVGFLFDFGYQFPVRGSGLNNQVDYDFIKGGTYFNPQITRILFDTRELQVYFDFGYKVYTFSEQYRIDFQPQTLIEDRITARFINIGLTLEFKPKAFQAQRP